jgi:hypothetical protein
MWTGEPVGCKSVSERFNELINEFTHRREHFNIYDWGCCHVEMTTQDSQTRLLFGDGGLVSCYYNGTNPDLFFRWGLMSPPVEFTRPHGK